MLLRAALQFSPSLQSSSNLVDDVSDPVDDVADDVSNTVDNASNTVDNVSSVVVTSFSAGSQAGGLFHF
jgi:hypothetical protein